jgi:hypothetical protein
MADKKSSKAGVKNIFGRPGTDSPQILSKHERIFPMTEKRYINELFMKKCV